MTNSTGCGFAFLCFFEGNYVYKSTNKEPLFVYEEDRASHLNLQHTPILLGFKGALIAKWREKKPAARRTKVNKYGLYTCRIFCFYQLRICIFKQTASLLPPLNLHAIVLLKGWQDSVVPQYCQGFSGCERHNFYPLPPSWLRRMPLFHSQAIWDASACDFTVLEVIQALPDVLSLQHSLPRTGTSGNSHT